MRRNVMSVIVPGWLIHVDDALCSPLAAGDLPFFFAASGAAALAGFLFLSGVAVTAAAARSLA